MSENLTLELEIAAGAGIALEIKLCGHWLEDLGLNVGRGWWL